jgi:hypothetical protein
MSSSNVLKNNLILQIVIDIGFFHESFVTTNKQDGKEVVMKKIMQLAFLGIVLLLISCNNDAQKNQINPLAIAIIPHGSSSLTVKATYIGTPATDGTGKIFVYLYDSLEATTRYPVPIYTGSTDSAVTPGVEANITIPDIADGDYYVLVFYDYHTGGNDDNQMDRYWLYNGTGYTAIASKLTIKGTKILKNVTFGNTYTLQPSSAFETATGHFVSLRATYNGTAGSGDQRIHVFLYSTNPGTTVSSPAPVYKVTSNDTVAPGDSASIVVSGVLPGNYYALVFYGYASSGTSIGVQDDRYIFYNNKQYPDEATMVTVGSSDVDLGSMSFGDSYVLGASGTFNSDFATVSVPVTYTGTNPTGAYMHVYLYDSLGTGATNPIPLYSGVSTGLIDSSDTTAMIDIPDVHFGTYHMLVFYDVDGSGSTGEAATDGDPYVLYENTQFTDEAVSFTVAGDTETNDVTIDDTNTLQASAAYMSRTLTVPVHFEGTESSASGAGYVYAYLYNSLGVNTSTPVPVFSGVSLNKATTGGDLNVYITGVTNGSYYLVVCYDADGTGGASAGDPYVLYDNKQYTADATTVTISGDTTVPVTLTLNDTPALLGGGAYRTPPATYSVTIPVQFNGTDSSATGAGYAYVYLYDASLGANTSTPSPAYTGVSAGKVLSGNSVDVNLSGVLGGNYYMLVFYDADGSGTATEGDPYILYNNKSYTADAAQVSISSNGSLSTVTVGDAPALQGGSAYVTPYTLTVPVRYTGPAGTAGDRKIHVSLYGALGATTASPAYTGSTVGAVTPGADATVSIPGIATGTYKMLVFYDYNSTGTTTGIAGDRYVLYVNTGSHTGYTDGGPSDVSISADMAIADRIIFGNTYRLQTGGAYMDSSKAYLTVYATYNGGTSGATGTKDIYLYLYTSLGANTRSTTIQAQAYTGLSASGGVAIGTEYPISINGITPGDYYVLSFFDFKSGGNADNQTDRYILYNGVHCTANASTFTLSSGVGYQEITGQSIINTWQLGASAAFNNTSCP